MVIKINSFRNTIEYALIIALYYVTGGAFSYSHYSLQISVLLIVSLGVCVFLGRIRYVLLRKVFVPWFCMSFFILLVPLLWGDSLTTYIAIIMQLSIGLFCAASIPGSEFVRKYVNVIVVFAAISLVGFVCGFIIPSVAFLFPVTNVPDASVEYYNAGVYVFMASKGFSGLVLTTRNAGICWEPGCYQCFLNLGLLFLLEKEKKEHYKKFFLCFFILIVTIITTVSTTGIIILFLLLN